MKTSLYFILLIIICVSAHQCQNNHTNEKAGLVVEKKFLWSETERSYLINGLQRVEQEVIDEVAILSIEQWSFKESPDRWSISEVIEHIELQNEMYYREIYLISKVPPMPDFVDRVAGNDSIILAYATDQVKGKTSWNLEPIGRFCDQPTAIQAFKKVSSEIIKFIKETDVDFRKHFTFRNYQQGGGLSNPGAWDVRDLHQLILTTIAHTDRHLNQIRKIKNHPDYPKE